MKNKKSLIFIVAILVLGISTSFAYFRGIVDIDNLFSVASWDNEAKEVFESPSTWKPGDVTQKEVSVKNNGNTPSRVRLSITEEWEDKNGNVLPLVYNGEKVAIINLSNTEDWIKSGNYYYYNKDLNGGEETSLFMESVTFNPNYKGDIECTLSNDGHSNTCLSTGNLYDGGTYQLNVYIEMVQANIYESVWGVLASDISNPNEFTVLLDTDGGLSSSYKAQATVGQTYNLPTPAKTGYVFKGWYKDNLFTEKVENTHTVDLNSDTTFYAKFVPLSDLAYSVAFATDDINCPLGNSYQTIQNANYGEIVSHNATPNPECIGYTFNGWNASNNINLGTAKYGSTSAPETPWVNGNKGTYFKALQDNGEDVTLTASWIVNIYEVTLDDGINPITIYEKYNDGWYLDSSATTSISTVTIPTKTGYTFNGYFTEQNGLGTKVINNDGTIGENTNNVLASNSSLYAYWIANKYTVEFASTQECPLNTTTYANITNISYDTLVKETAIANPECTGYTFTGWTASGDINTSTAKYGITSSPATAWINGNKGTFFKNLSTTNNGTVTLTAGWTPTIYEITLNNQSATTIGTTEIFEKYSTNWYSESSATNVITTITKPVKTGYYFDGYYTGQNGTGTKVIDSNGTILSTNTAFTSNTTLYAYWVEVWAENLSFNGNFTGFNCSDTQCAIGELYDLLISREKK